MSDLAGVSPEEMDYLREALRRFDESQQNHPDAKEDMAMIAPLAQAVGMLADKLAEVEQKIDAMSNHYFNDLIGGIRNLYDENARSIGIDALKSKYAETFEPHMGYINALMGDDGDLWGKMHDHIKMHYDDDDFDPDDFIDQILDDITANSGKMREALKGPAEVVKVRETEEPEEAPTGVDEDELRDAVKRLRGR